MVNVLIALRHALNPIQGGPILLSHNQLKNRQMKIVDTYRPVRDSEICISFKLSIFIYLFIL
jgi:hypothetical protein